jgi:hypothetical protein
MADYADPGIARASSGIDDRLLPASPPRPCRIVGLDQTFGDEVPEGAGDPIAAGGRLCSECTHGRATDAGLARMTWTSQLDKVLEIDSTHGSPAPMFSGSEERKTSTPGNAASMARLIAAAISLGSPVREKHDHLRHRCDLLSLDHFSCSTRPCATSAVNGARV